MIHGRVGVCLRISISIIFFWCLLLPVSLVRSDDGLEPFPTPEPSTLANPTFLSLISVTETETIKLNGIKTIMGGETPEHELFGRVTNNIILSGLNYHPKTDFFVTLLLVKVLNQKILPGEGLLVEVEIEGFLEQQLASEADFTDKLRDVLRAVTTQIQDGLQTENIDFFLPLLSVEVVDSTPSPTLSPSFEPLILNTSSPSLLQVTTLPTFLPSLVPSPTLSPSLLPVTSSPTTPPSLAPVTSPPTSPPSSAPVTSSPSSQPSMAPVTSFPTTPPSIAPVTPSPTKLSLIPVTQAPTKPPTDQPTSSTPTLKTNDPTSARVTPSPTDVLNSLDPTEASSSSPTVEQLQPPVTTDPTDLPVPLATLQPSTDSPTELPSILPMGASKEKKDIFRLQLYPVATNMTIEIEEFFGTKVEEFLSDIFGALERPITIVDLEVLKTFIVTRTRLRRSLEEIGVQVDMGIKGTFIPINENDDVDLASTSRNYLINYQDKLITSLQESDRNEFSVYFANIEEITDANGPTFSPTSQPNIFTKVSESSGLSAGAISGIVIGGVLVLLLIVGMLIWPQRRGQSRRKEPGSTGNSATSSKRRFLTPRKKKETPSQNLPQRQESKRSDVSRSENDSVGLSELHSHLGNETVAGNDTMSYAYSLDHGIDPSVSSANTGYYTQNSYQAAGGGIAQKAKKRDGGKQVQRECFAPPGKLGVVIDTTPEGPVVHKVNPGSPLEGIVWPGDIIVAIDDEDTRLLSATEITALMVKNMNQRRKLSVVSDAL